MMFSDLPSTVCGFWMTRPPIASPRNSTATCQGSGWIPSVMASAFSHLLRFGLGYRHNKVSIKAKLDDGPEGEQPLSIFIAAPHDKSMTRIPQLFLDPVYVMDHPEIDLGLGESAAH